MSIDKPHRPRTGFTLVEVMLAVVLVIVASLGTLCYQYLCMKHVRAAQVLLTGTRIGQLLLEDWKSTGGTDDYDPEYLGMGFETIPGEPGDAAIILDNVPFYIRMYHEQVDRDDFAGVVLSKLSVTVRWKKDFGDGTIEDTDPGVHLATYVRQDQ